MLDIILEFGEHYYNGSDKSLLLQLVFSFIGPLLGFGTALIFYYKKIKNDTKIDKEKMLNATNSEKQKLQFEYKNRIKYFNLIVSDIINKSKEQNENILKNIIEQKKDLLNTRVFKTISTSSFKRLYSTDNKGVFEAYYHEFDNRNTEWIYIYNDIYTCLSFLEEIRNEFKRISVHHIDACYKSSIEIRNILESIPDKIESYMISMKRNGTDKTELFAYFNECLKKYTQISDESENIYDIDKMYNEFVEPFIMRFLFENYKLELITDEITLLARQAKVRISDMKYVVSFNVGLFEKAHEDVNTTIKRLDFLLNELNKFLVK